MSAKDSSEAKVRAIFDELFQEAMNRKPLPTYPKIGTIKAMVDLGNDWHEINAVQRELAKVQKSGNIYSLYLARLYPDLIEVDVEKRVRIKPNMYQITKKLIKKYADEILAAIAEKRKLIGSE
jgi:hypothetical protein